MSMERFVLQEMPVDVDLGGKEGVRKKGDGI